MIPEVITEVDFANDPTATTRTWSDLSSRVRRADPTHGREDEYSDFGPGTNTIVFRDNDRALDATNVSSAYYPNVVPMRPIRQYVRGPLIGTEFWGDFEAGADGTAPEWTNLNGLLECKAGAEARQLQYVATPTPRLGARIGRFEVASGDQFGATSGERCEVRRGATNGGFGTGNLEGVTVFTGFSTRFLAPWTLTGEGIFHQTHDSGSTYGAPMFRWRMGASSNIEFRVVTGRYPNSTDAGNGVNAGTNNTHTGLAFATDVWFDFRHAIYYTTGSSGWYIAEMKLSTDSAWTRVAQVGLTPTLPSYPGSAATSQFDKLGFYRGTPQASTNVVYQDGYQVGHSWTDVSYSGYTTDSRWNDKGWEGREQATTQGGNPDFEVDIVGTSSAGGGTTTRTWDTTRSKFGSGALKMVTNGAAGGQGAFHTKRSGSRYSGIVAGDVITVSAWFSGDGFEEVRMLIEWFDAGGSSLSTTTGTNLALRTDFRRHHLTATAPANAVTFRIRTSLTGTAAATYWVDGVDWWMGTMSHSLFEGYVEKWETSTDRLFQLETTASCVDSRAVLNMVGQPVSDPNVEEYESVINYDQPSLYYRLGEDAGTKLVSHVRKRKRKKGESKQHYKKHGIHRHHRRMTREEVEGVSGPSGSYKNTPLLGEPGIIAGDSDTSVRFRSSQSEGAKIVLDQGDLLAGNTLTVECWIKFNSLGAAPRVIISGPFASGPGDSVFELLTDDTLGGGTADELWAFIYGSPGPTKVIAFADAAVTTGVWYYIVFTWDGTVLRLYRDLTLIASSASVPVDLVNGDAGEPLWLARYASGFYSDIWLDEVAVYEKVLSDSRLSAHYTASLRGYNQELTGTRIANAITASGVTLTQDLGTGAHYVLPTRQFGQPSIDPITEAVAAEGGMSGFFFNAAGVAVFLPRDYRDTYPYTANQATFGDLGDGTELPYDDLEEDTGTDRLFNQVRIEADGGTLQQADDTTSQGNFFVRTLEETGLPMVSNDDALTEANWLLSRSKDPRWRFTSITFPAHDVDGIFQLQQALCRECGDAITVKRRPKNQTAVTQIASVERVTHSIDFENESWVTTYGLAPLADDLSTGWVLGVPGQTELQSTAVLN